MVATDIAARGIDVSGVELVVHVDPPAEHKAYLHRSGRTARAGAAGTVVTLVLPEQKHDVQVLLKKARIKATIERRRADDTAVADLVGETAPAVAVKDMPEGVAIKGGNPTGRKAPHGSAKADGGAGAGGRNRRSGGRGRGTGQGQAGRTGGAASGQGAGYRSDKSRPAARSGAGRAGVALRSEGHRGSGHSHRDGSRGRRAGR